MKTTKRSVDTIKHILSCYESFSGRKINYNKSELCLSKNIDLQESMNLSSSLNITRVPHHSQYLGLPFVYGSNKSEAFQNFVEKCHKCTANWSNKVLSAAGKEIFIKSVLQALPTFMMSCFRFPISVLQKLHSVIINFWWGAEIGKRKTHWLNRNVLLKQKLAGGLGLKNLQSFNSALLAKQGWRLPQNPGSLLSYSFETEIFPRL